MTHVSCTEVAVNGFHASQVRVAGKQIEMKLLVQLIKRSAITHGHVVNLVHGFGVLRGGGQQVGLHHVGNEAEVAAGFTVAVNIDGLAFDHAGDPLGNDRRIGTIGVLAWAKDVEIAQADALQAVGFAKDVCVQFIHIFGNCIR